MSLADLKSGTFKTASLKALILRELNELEKRAKVDEDCGRLVEARKKRWLAQAVSEYMRLTDNQINWKQT
jgi:hypothetical protein